MAEARPQRQKRARGRGRGVRASRDTDAAALAPAVQAQPNPPSGRGRGRGRGRGFGAERRPGSDEQGAAGIGRGALLNAAKAAAANASRDRTVSEASEGGGDDPDLCTLCDSKRKFTSVGSCGHALCHVCMIRLRHFPNKEKNPDNKEKEIKWPCPICREPLDKVIMSEGTQAHYDPTAVQYLPIDKKLKVAFDSDTAEEAFHIVVDIRCMECPGEAQTSLDKMDTLRRHLSHDHQKFHCDLCISHQKLFVWEHKIYTRKELAKHKRSRDPVSNAEIHPKCQFCDVRLFDGEALSEHMYRKHELCHLCDKAGKPHQFFVDYQSLEDHFAKDHFLCSDPECRASKTAMFFTKHELEAHIAATHSASGRISLQSFAYGNDRRRAGGRGQSAPTVDEQDNSGASSPQPQPPQDLFDGPSLSAAAGRTGGNAAHPTGAAAIPQWAGHSNAPITAALASTSADNFPSLGGPSSAPKSTAALGGMWVRASSSASTRHTRSVARTAPNVSGGDFPTLGGPGRSSTGNWSATSTARSRSNAPVAGTRQPVATSYSQSGSAGDNDYEPAILAGPSEAPNYKVAPPSIAVVSEFESRQQKLAAHKSGPIPVVNSGEAFPTLGGSSSGKKGIQWGGGVKVKAVTASKKGKSKQAGAFTFTTAPAKSKKKSVNTPSAPPSASTISASIAIGGNDGEELIVGAASAPAYKGPSEAPGYREAPPSIALVTEFESREQKLAAHKSGSVPVVQSQELFPSLGGPPLSKGGIQWGGGVKAPKPSASKKKQHGSLSITVGKNKSKKNANTASRSLYESREPTLTLESEGAVNDSTFSKPKPKGPSQAPEYREAAPSIAVVTEFESREQKMAAHRSETLPEVKSDEVFPGLGESAVANPPTWEPKKKVKAKANTFVDPSLVGGTIDYIAPPNFDDRNAALIGAILDIIPEEDFERFREESTKMRSGDIGFRRFFKTCLDLLGRQATFLFPELVALLPDIEMQQNLYVAAREHEQRKKAQKSGVEKLSVCPFSGQILIAHDVPTHTAQMEAMSFPNLSGSS